MTAKNILYKFNGLANVCHIAEWPIYNDWFNICKKGDTAEIDTFYKQYVANLNKTLRDESRVTHKYVTAEKPYIFYDSAWSADLPLDYNPHDRLVTYTAREAIVDCCPVETISWFAKQEAVNRLQIVYAVNSLITIRRLREARIALALFPDLPFETAAQDVGTDIFRGALMTGDIPLIHEIWLLGALKSPEAIELADAACFQRGWVPVEAVEWYKMHRDLEPVQKITGRYGYLEPVLQ